MIQEYEKIFNHLKEITQSSSPLKTAYNYNAYKNNSDYQLVNQAVIARDKNFVIGTGETIYWNLPKDMENFKNDTLNSIVIMGRVTFNSFPKDKSGCYLTLKDRLNIVISRNAQEYYKENLNNTKFKQNLFFVESLEQAHLLSLLIFTQDQSVKALEQSFALKPGLISTIGGERVYLESLDKENVLIPLTDLILTEVDLVLDTNAECKKFIFNEKDYQENYNLQQTFNGAGENSAYVKCIKRHLKLV
ncbi:hypothetical protein CJP74_04110 [Psittacicella melopsittaci]|uniref:dihydrofolate reductase n=1 Tax=Psittacicella melopsittaci TaxID=2028576 RepID=A0A3A1Y5C5_9GAMM|nr:dihydrofolate reductase [Psittacicella melopsittaci]RIY32570.1 hypothetical protein CJP74_04110 [Psittacicella melopsittaci]